MKKTARILLGAGMALLVAALYLFVLRTERERERTHSCVGLKVQITDSAKLSFVSEKDIADYIERDYGPYIGERLSEVDLRRIENVLSERSAIRGSEAWLDRDGYIRIDVTQREPAVRFQKGGQGFYADEKGFLFPLQKNYTSRVPIIDGAIPIEVGSGHKGRPDTEQGQRWLEEIISLVTYMQRTDWSRRIAQITIRPDGNLIMIPAEGQEQFLFGTPEDPEAKFERIATYYEAVAPTREKAPYTRVDVRYDKQIICK